MPARNGHGDGVLDVEPSPDGMPGVGYQLMLPEALRAGGSAG